MTLLRLDLPTAVVLTVGVLSFTVGAVSRPSGPPPTGFPSGAIEGVVRLEIAQPAAPTVMNPYARRRYRPPAEPSASAETPESVIVFVPVAPGSAPRHEGSVRIVQRDRRILPASSAV